ncbi:hypothetical protein H6F39_12465 [Anabaena sp. FACHB-1250]|uniref:hypothetical protein n=1 Tax=unclassified Anabaena TaxID=2619674 RepID=UPI0016809699|nr:MULTISPECIES: hypothetical protein [unclassified Anabaena]MBD2142145.1 hypothetical protein [Anabaena sp. FACHB-1250]MBD2269628.1 hypothetical protein [Anabaena sp. FACHB-1391]
MADQFEWQFHFHNFNEHNLHVRVHHDCGTKDPWHDGRPGCWEYNLPYSPTGSLEGVFRPGKWVRNFHDWWDIIKDGLKLNLDLGILFTVPEPKIDDLADVVSNVFGIERDIIEALIRDMNDEEIQQILNTAYQSLDQTCKDNYMDPAIVRQMAKDMDLDPNAWGIIAGTTYRHYIWHNSSPLVNHHGWSVFRSWGQKNTNKNNLFIAEACFIDKGHLIYPCDVYPCDGGDHPKYGNTFWQFWSGYYKHYKNVSFGNVMVIEDCKTMTTFSADSN